jgi:hypothetical protein
MRRSVWAVAFLVSAIVACSDASTRPGSSSLGSPAPTSPPVARTFVVLQALSDTGISASAASAVPDAPRVRVTDDTGKPVAGVRVSFAVIRGSGSLRDTLVTSDAEGVATSGTWILGPTYGEVNLVVAGVMDMPQYFADAPVYFSAFAVMPDAPGVRYDLQMRDGQVLRPGERGWMILSDDGTFHIVWLWGSGRNAYSAINTGTYTQVGQQFTLYEGAFCCDGQATAVISGNTLTFTYDDYYDIGFHSIVVEVYERETSP